MRLLLRIKIFAVLLLAGCARQQLMAPSPTAVQGGLSRVQVGASEAEAQRMEIIRRSNEARAYNDRIDAKDAFIEGYRKWKSTHP